MTVKKSIKNKLLIAIVVIMITLGVGTGIYIAVQYQTQVEREVLLIQFSEAYDLNVVRYNNLYDLTMVSLEANPQITFNEQFFDRLDSLGNLLAGIGTNFENKTLLNEMSNNDINDAFVLMKNTSGTFTILEDDLNEVLGTRIVKQTIDAGVTQTKIEIDVTQANKTGLTLRKVKPEIRYL